MKNAKKNIDITPDTSLLPKLGRSGYRFFESISEFIENSLEAPENGQETVTVSINLDEENLVIMDDARGMDEPTLINGLRIAYGNGENKKFAEFGMGMKTAATSLGKNFSIHTSMRGEREWHVFNYDEDEWKKIKDWKSSYIVSEEKKDKNSHGTIIIIRNFKFSYYGNLVTNTKDKLSSRYANYLRTKELKLLFNGKTMPPQEKELMILGGKKKHNFTIPTKSGYNISGWWGVLEKRNVRGDYGFDLFRNQRLIEEHAKIGFEPHPEIAMLVGEMHLDHVPVTHNKRGFITESPEYQESKSCLEEYLEKNNILYQVRTISKAKTNERKHEKLMNRMEIISGSSESLKNLDKKDIDVRNPYLEYYDENLKNRINLVENGERELSIFGKKIKFSFSWDNSGVEKNIVRYYTENNKIIIVINTDFPFFRLTKDTTAYTMFLIAESLAHHLIKTLDIRNIDTLQLRNFLLRKFGEEEERMEDMKRKTMRLEKLKKEIKKIETGD